MLFRETMTSFWESQTVYLLQNTDYLNITADEIYVN
jgi:hypothetical protein